MNQPAPIYQTTYRAGAHGSRLSWVHLLELDAAPAGEVRAILQDIVAARVRAMGEQRTRKRIAEAAASGDLAEAYILADGLRVVYGGRR